MADTIEELEQRRTSLYQQMQALGDFRPGTFSVNFRKCGKKGCACAQPGHSAHGPQYLWNTTSGGQSRAQNLRLGPELEKAQGELENHQVFLRLCRELVEVNEKICRLRPVAQIKDENELQALKKNCRSSSRRGGAGSRSAGCSGPSEISDKRGMSTWRRVRWPFAPPHTGSGAVCWRSCSMPTTDTRAAAFVVAGSLAARGHS